ncbi:uncharacterized protein LOC126565682 [Anopheles maculipalpis]|uniref:uncharacterized protein LOC126565682 n=1 Tax=Anopheles maculipalpis TaxID=1496333 RepID=UPI0021598353|nr:uncharacterized protein LOC126565682 [Anopheles maculipalpis]
MFASSWSNYRAPKQLKALLRLLAIVVSLAAPGKVFWTEATVSCNAIARWPALDYKSDRAFYPLMVSFSRYPFHDVYEANPGVLPSNKHSTVAASVGPAAAGRPGLPKARKNFFPPGVEQNHRNWRHQSHARMPTKNVCQGLIYLPQQLQASGRRMLPLKMRKLLKYCGFI